MKITTSDKALAYLTLFSGLAISAVAIWYSVAGLVAIFAAAAIPIIIMGTVLELSKLVATVWLKWNWKRAPTLIRVYLLTAIAVLSLLTSMGIFGFLSKAHLDQAVPTGDVAAKVSIIDEKIKTERDNIETARKALAQMDAQVDQVLGRTDSAQGAERAVQIRRNQARERTALQNEISKAQAVIAKLNEERAPIAAELRKVEAEVGPIKYIAALIYGDNPDNNLLEKAVRWMIIVIVLVFDPLAVILLLASQYSFQWIRSAKEEEPDTVPEVEKTEPEPIPEPEVVPKDEAVVEPIQFTGTPASSDNKLLDKVPTSTATVSGDITSPERFGLKRFEPVIEEVNPEDVIEEIVPEDDSEIIDQAAALEREAMTRWKMENPRDSLKHQRRLFELGIIDKLPWEDYLAPKPDYVQNEEQSSNTIWQRLKSIKK